MNHKKILLSDIASLFNGKTPSKDQHQDEGFPVLKIKDIAEIGKFKGVFDSFIDSELAQKFSRKILKLHDVLILNAAHNADYVGSKIYIVDEQTQNSLATGEWLIIRSNLEKVNPYYIYYWFRNGVSREIIRKLVKGIHLYPKDVANIEIDLPTLLEQKQIASLLDKADALRRKRQQAMDLLDEFLRSTFLEMFGDPVKNNKNWPVAKLYEVSSIQSGVTKGRKLNGKQILSVPYMRVANVQDGYINITDLKYIEALPSDIEKYKLLYNDILLTEGGDPDKLGRGAIWKYYIKDCVYQNHIFRVRVHPDILNPEYFSALIGSGYGKRYFLKSAKQTTGIASINATQLKNFPVLIPPMKLQENFSRVIGAVESIREKMQKSREEMENLFNSLMQRAFKGELQINEKGDGAR